jgi:hypothetical protein
MKEMKTMGDYFPGRITIGGPLAAAMVDDLICAINGDGPNIGKDYSGDDHDDTQLEQYIR